jgi:hypothetical protein
MRPELLCGGVLLDTHTASVYFTPVNGARQLEQGVNYECLGESDKGIP